MKLPVKIGIIVSAVAIPAAAFFLFLMYGMIRNAMSSPIEQQQQGVATQTLDSLDRYLYERTHELKIVSQSGTVRSLSVNPTNKAAQAQAVTRLQEVSEPTDSWNRLDVVDKTGRIAASTVPEAIGRSTIEDNYHNAVVQKALTGETAYSDVLLERGEPTMVFALPVHPSQASAGQPVSAVLTGHLNWQGIVELLKVVPHDSVNVYNNQGVEIANKDNQVTLSPAPNPNSAISKGLTGESGSQVIEDNLIAFTNERGHKDYHGNGWVLTVTTPTQVAFAPATEVSINVAIMLSLSTLGVMVAITFLVGRLIKPIDKLTQSANRLALGDLTQRVKVASKNEIGELGVAFNNMADKLQQLYKNLELKVQQKTAQLAEEVNKVDAERAKDEAIITSIGEGIIAIDSRGAVVKINQPAVEILGLENGNIIGKKLVEAFVLYDEYDKEVPLDRRQSVQAISGSGSSDELYTVHRKDGAKVKVAFLSTPILQQGKVLGGIMVLRDVTKEREVDRMKTEFISLASHQLRTPL
ncbi:MAG TPA: HAMP domain-containing protein, partial [Candidatus Saccharimonadales bacterium]|nr:HAMP domain-containing protein [Candidatus Saccharimonadales bacterium]